MAELGRVANSWNFNFRGVPTFLQVCEKRFQATRKFYGIFAQRWFCYISINYLGRKIYTFRNEIETKTISLNCFSKYRSRGSADLREITNFGF